jgi:hypothetical protein
MKVFQKRLPKSENQSSMMQNKKISNNLSIQNKMMKE